MRLLDDQLVDAIVAAREAGADEIERVLVAAAAEIGRLRNGFDALEVRIEILRREIERHGRAVRGEPARVEILN